MVMLSKNMINKRDFSSMQVTYLQIVEFLGKNGYYARTEAEKNILGELVRKGFVKLKNGTKSVFHITEDGENYLKQELNPNTKIKDHEFLNYLKTAYDDLANPMNPLVRIPDIRRRLINKRIPDSFFNKKVLELHDKGVITLQTALSKAHAVHGGINSDSGIGVFYYLMFEA